MPRKKGIAGKPMNPKDDSSKCEDSAQEDPSTEEILVRSDEEAPNKISALLYNEDYASCFTELTKKLVSHPSNTTSLVTDANIAVLNYIGRKHGLPREVYEPLVSILLVRISKIGLQNEGADANKNGFPLTLKVAQTLKHCATKDLTSIRPSQLLDLINCCPDDLLPQSKSLHLILTEVILALKDHQDFLNNADNKELKSILQRKLEHLDSECKAKIQFSKPTAVDASSVQNRANTSKSINNSIALEEQPGKRLSKLKPESVKAQEAAMLASAEIVSQQENKTHVEHGIFSAESCEQISTPAAIIEDPIPLKALLDIKQTWPAGNYVTHVLETVQKNKDKPETEILLSKATLETLCKLFDLDSFKFSLYKSNFEVTCDIAQILAIVSQYQGIPSEGQHSLLFVADQVFKKIYDHSNPADNLKATTKCRLNVLTAIENNIRHNTRSVSAPLCEILDDFVANREDSTLEMKKAITRIRYQREGKTVQELCSEFAEMCLIIRDGPSDDDREKAVNLVYREISLQKQCNILYKNCIDFYNQFLEILILFIVDTNNSINCRVKVANVLEKYLSYSFTGPLPIAQVKKLSDLLLVKETGDQLRLHLIQCFLYCLMKPGDEVHSRELKESQLISILIKCVWNDELCIPREVQGLIVVSIERWSRAPGNLDYCIPNTSRLAPLILWKDTISGKLPVGESTVESDPQKSLINVSAVVAQLLMAQIRHVALATIKKHVLPQVLLCLQIHKDPSTRICCSQYILKALDTYEREVGGDSSIVNLLNELSFNDPVPAVNIYTTEAYCKGIYLVAQGFLKNGGTKPSEFPLQSCHVTKMTELYTWKKLVLNGRDFADSINFFIWNVLAAAAEHSTIIFSQATFDFLREIPTTEIDEEITAQSFNIFNLYTSRDTTPGSEYTIKFQESIYNFYTIESHALSRDCEKYFYSLLLRGQSLPDTVLSEILKHFLGFENSFIEEGQESIERYKEMVEIFYLANQNQDVPDLIFEHLDMELAGATVLHYFGEAEYGLFKDLLICLKGEKFKLFSKQPTLESIEKALSDLCTYASRSLGLSLLNCRVAMLCLASKAPTDLNLMACNLLATFVENRQHIPMKMLGGAFEALERSTMDNWPTVESFTILKRLCVSLLDSNQSLPEHLCPFIFDKIMNCMLLQTSSEFQSCWLALVSKLTEYKYKIPPDGVSIICRAFLEQSLVQQRDEVLNTLVRLIENRGIDASIVGSISKVFMDTFGNKEGHISSVNEMQMSLFGLKLLQEYYRARLSDQEIQQICSHVSNSDLDDISRQTIQRVAKKIMDRSITFGLKLRKCDDRAFVIILLDRLESSQGLPSKDFWTERLKGIAEDLNSISDSVQVQRILDLISKLGPDDQRMFTQNPKILEEIAFTLSRYGDEMDIARNCTFLLDKAYLRKEPIAIQSFAYSLFAKQ